MMTSSQENNLGYEILNLDEESVKRLLDCYESPLYRFFYYSIGNFHDAQDLCSQTWAEFVKAVKSKRFREPDCLSGFLFGIARNLLLQTNRKSKKSLYLSDELNQRICHHINVSRQVGARDELNAVFRVIVQFKEPERQVMLLRFVENFKVQDIALAMDLPINSVKSYIHRCRKQLKQHLSQNHYESRENSYGK
jgi:RNA polymerase sigma factor (sigma-70 family)